MRSRFGHGQRWYRQPRHISVQPFSGEPRRAGDPASCVLNDGADGEWSRSEYDSVSEGIMAIQLIVASPEPRFHDFVREQLARTPSAEIVSEHEDTGPNLPVRIAHDLTVHPQAGVLLDVSSDSEQGLRALEQMRQSSPSLYAILSGLQLSEEFLLRAMRMGGSDFLPQPLKRAEFNDAMTRLEEHLQRVHRQGRQLGRMYTFVGVKGGVGTTTAAVNFAALSARQNKSTVLVDLDMDSGDIACYLGLRHQYSLADVVESLDQLDQAMLDGIVARDPLGFSVLCAPTEFERSQNIGEQQLREIGTFLIERHDVVVVDGSRPPGSNPAQLPGTFGFDFCRAESGVPCRAQRATLLGRACSRGIRSRSCEVDCEPP